MLIEFEKKVAQYIASQRLFATNESILPAISGGADSTAMLHCFCALKNAGLVGGQLVCAHINHQLRGIEADSDEQFVIEMARKFGLEVETRRVDVLSFAAQHKLSIETAGRKLRIKALSDIAASRGIGVVATAHQKNDNAETVLQRMVRGTGFRGLGGIRPAKEFDGVRFIRPLLCLTRDGVIEYLEGKGAGWCLDHTNLDYSYRRNFIRHLLLPEMQKKFEGSIVDALCELASAGCGLYARIYERVEELWIQAAQKITGNLVVDLHCLSGEHPEVQIEIVRRALFESGYGEGNLRQEHFERIAGLIHKQSGKKIELPGGFIVRLEYGKLVFEKEQTEKAINEDKERQLTVPGVTEFGNVQIECKILDSGTVDLERFKREKDKSVEWFDFNRISLPLVVRRRRVGDKFVPFGQSGRKRVGKFLTAEKTPKQLRKRVLVFADAEKIICIWPVRISEQARIGPATQKILQIRTTTIK